MDSDKSDYLLEIKTVQVSAFRTLIEALKEILVEANFETDQDGIKIKAMDASHTVLVYLRLYPDRFEKFYCKQKTNMGINLTNFFAYFDTSSFA